MNRFIHFLSLILLVIFGVGCTGLQYTPIPTPFPANYVATAIAQTARVAQAEPTTAVPYTPADFPPVSSTPAPESTSTTGSSTPALLESSPSVTSSPAISPTPTTNLSATPTRRATRTPTITPTPPIPNAGVQIPEPGPMSRVISPVHLVSNLHSVPSGSYHVELLIESLQPGEQPRRLYREVVNLISEPVPWVYLDEQIEFELSRVSEFGQLRLSVFDKYDRPVSVNSVDLILLSIGENELTPKGDRSEPIVIREPTQNHLIQGGKVIVSGLVKPVEDVLVAQLIAADGTVAGYSQLFVTPSPDGSYVPYTIEVPYQVQKSTWVRLTVSESGVRIPGIEHLSSVEIYLTP